MSLSTLLKYHAFALVLAALAGTYCVAPQLYFATHAPGYAGITMMGADGEEHYLARMQEVRDGYPGVGNVFLPNKNQPYFAPAGGEIVADSIGLPFGLTAAQTETLGKFLFPFFAALAWYALGFAVTRSRAASLVMAALILLGDSLNGGASAWLGLLHGQASGINFLAYYRPINPEVSGIILALGLLFIYRAFFARSARSWEIVAFALTLGVTLYISVYIYTFLGMCVLLSLLWCIYKRERKQILQALIIGITGLLGALPFLLNHRALVAAQGYAESAVRQGVLSTHAPVVGLWLPILIFLACFLWPSRYRMAQPFFIIAAASVLILSNQQLVTGQSLQVNHYHWYITKPLVSMVLIMYLVYGLERLVTSQRIRIALWSLGLVVICYNAFLIQTASYRAFYAETLASQAYAPVLAFINSSPKGQAVWADTLLSRYISIYTSADTLNNEYAMYYLVPQSYLEERLFLNYKLRSISPADALLTMQRERADISNLLYGVYWRDKTGSMSGIPDEILQKLSEKYATYQSRSVAQMMKNFGITLLIKDTFNDAWATSNLTGLIQTNTINNRFTLYTVH